MVVELLRETIWLISDPNASRDPLRDIRVFYCENTIGGAVTARTKGDRDEEKFLGKVRL